MDIATKHLWSGMPISQLHDTQQTDPYQVTPTLSSLLAVPVLSGSISLASASPLPTLSRVIVDLLSSSRPFAGVQAPTALACLRRMTA